MARDAFEKHFVSIEDCFTDARKWVQEHDSNATLRLRSAFGDVPPPGIARSAYFAEKVKSVVLLSASPPDPVVFYTDLPRSLTLPQGTEPSVCGPYKLNGLGGFVLFEGMEVRYSFSPIYAKQEPMAVDAGTVLDLLAGKRGRSYFAGYTLDDPLAFLSELEGRRIASIYDAGSDADALVLRGCMSQMLDGEFTAYPLQDQPRTIESEQLTLDTIKTRAEGKRLVIIANMDCCGEHPNTLDDRYSNITPERIAEVRATCGSLVERLYQQCRESGVNAKIFTGYRQR